MRTYVKTGGLVAASSTLAFLAGLRVGPAEASVVAQSCVTAPAIMASQHALAPSVEQPSEKSAAPEAPAEDDARDWPYRAWPAADATGDHLYSKVKFLWIRPEPRPSEKWLGYLSVGDAVRVKGGDKAKAYAGKSQSLHCSEWYAVEPRGFVCIDEQEATFDPKDPAIAELVKRRANPMSPWPYQYGESTGTPIYGTIPPLHRQRKEESALDDHLARVRRARGLAKEEERVAVDPMFAGVDLSLTNMEPPPMFELGPRGRTTKSRVVAGSTIAFTDAFDVEGRSFILGWDKGVIPRDRVKIYPQSSFHGVPMSDEVKLPIAFFRKAQKKYRRDGDTVVETGESWPRYANVMVTDDLLDIGEERYMRTKENDLWVSVDGTTVARHNHEIPQHIRDMKEGRRTWVDVSVMRGFLVAYENDKPVYATMVAPGRGGIPKDGVDPLVTASTPVGKFRVTGKFLSATMVSNASKDIIHDEVMYTQNFTGPYALHGAYWHDEWGVGKSGGCVNLSPIDARRLFKWSEPQLPPGWHGVQLVTGYENALSEYENATLVYTHK